MRGLLDAGELPTLRRIYRTWEPRVTSLPQTEFRSLITPLEAMASGLPLVAPTTGGVTTYASDETAWLAPAEPEHFARCVQQIFAHPDVRVRKTERALAVARGYRWERVAGQFFDTYEKLVNRRSCEPFSAAVIATS